MNNNQHEIPNAMDEMIRNIQQQRTQQLFSHSNNRTVVDDQYVSQVEQTVRIDLLYKQLTNTLKDIINETCKQMINSNKLQQRPLTDGLYASVDFGKEDMELKSRENHVMKRMFTGEQDTEELNYVKQQYEKELASRQYVMPKQQQVPVPEHVDIVEPIQVDVVVKEEEGETVESEVEYAGEDTDDEHEQLLPTGNANDGQFTF
jgi:hypothetical protein